MLMRTSKEEGEKRRVEAAARD
jgi:hypothetical protein